MSAQPSLFDWQAPSDERPKLLSRYEQPSLEERWRVWIAQNEPVYRMFVRFSFEAIEAGHEHYSADAIVHRMRWHTSVESRGSDFKIDNNMIRFLSRRFSAEFPAHQDFFRRRGEQ